MAKNLPSTIFRSPSKVALGMMALLFLMCGFSTALNAVLVPHLKKVLKLGYQEVALVDTSFYLAYFLVCPIAGFLLSGQDLRWGVRIGFIIAGFGPLFIGLASSFPVALLGVFILGSGIAILQVSANPYVIQLGDPAKSANRLSFSQAMTNLGTIIAPLLGSALLLSEEKAVTMETLRFPYWTLALIWALFALLALFLRLPEGKKEAHSNVGVLRDQNLWRFFLAISICVGVEVSCIAFLIPFLHEPEILAVSLTSAGKWSALFWVGFFVGRLSAGFLLKKTAPMLLLFLHAAAGFFLALITCYTEGVVAAGALLSLGFCTSVMFPILFTLALQKSKVPQIKAAGILCMANIGGALVPLLQGSVADHIGLHHSFLVPASCYFLLVLFSLSQLRFSLPLRQQALQ